MGEREELQNVGLTSSQQQHSPLRAGKIDVAGLHTSKRENNLPNTNVGTFEVMRKFYRLF